MSKVTKIKVNNLKVTARELPFDQRDNSQLKVSQIPEFEIQRNLSVPQQAQKGSKDGKNIHHNSHHNSYHNTDHMVHHEIQNQTQEKNQLIRHKISSKHSDKNREKGNGKAGGKDIDKDINKDNGKEKENVTRRIRKSVWKANQEFNLVQEGDKILVCLSGGKDSYTMLEMLLHMQSTPLLNFEIIAVNLDQKQPGFPAHILPKYLENKGVPYSILEKDTYSVVVDKTPQGKTMCSLCSRLRRGTLYQAAKEMGCNKVALGHHREDILETFFLNLYFSGKLETMPPIYETDDKQLLVIRPLAFTKEQDISTYAQFMDFPIIPCTLCGSQEGMQRQTLKKMMNDWEEQFPNRKEVVFNALKNISPSHLLDKDLFNFPLS